MSYFRNQPETGVTSPSQIAVVGDRLFTDVMMANMMGAHGFWISEGVVEEKGLVRINLDTFWSIADDSPKVCPYGEEACWLLAKTRLCSSKSSKRL